MHLYLLVSFEIYNEDFPKFLTVTTLLEPQCKSILTRVRLLASYHIKIII